MTRVHVPVAPGRDRQAPPQPPSDRRRRPLGPRPRSRRRRRPLPGSPVPRRRDRPARRDPVRVLRRRHRRTGAPPRHLRHGRRSPAPATVSPGKSPRRWAIRSPTKSLRSERFSEPPVSRRPQPPTPLRRRSSSSSPAPLVTALTLVHRGDDVVIHDELVRRRHQPRIEALPARSTGLRPARSGPSRRSAARSDDEPPSGSSTSRHRAATPPSHRSSAATFAPRLTHTRIRSASPTRTGIISRPGCPAATQGWARHATQGGSATQGTVRRRKQPGGRTVNNSHPDQGAARRRRTPDTGRSPAPTADDGPRRPSR